jgi:hypothetical protein
MNKKIPEKTTNTRHGEIPPVLIFVAVGAAMAMFLFLALFGEM